VDRFRASSQRPGIRVCRVAGDRTRNHQCGIESSKRGLILPWRRSPVLAFPAAGGKQRERGVGSMVRIPGLGWAGIGTSERRDDGEGIAKRTREYLAGHRTCEAPGCRLPAGLVRRDAGGGAWSETLMALCGLHGRGPSAIAGGGVAGGRQKPSESPARSSYRRSALDVVAPGTPDHIGAIIGRR